MTGYIQSISFPNRPPLIRLRKHSQCTHIDRGWMSCCFHPWNIVQMTRLGSRCCLSLVQHSDWNNILISISIRNLFNALNKQQQQNKGRKLVSLTTAHKNATKTATTFIMAVVYFTINKLSLFMLQLICCLFISMNIIYWVKLEPSN